MSDQLPNSGQSVKPADVIDKVNASFAAARPEVRDLAVFGIFSGEWGALMAEREELRTAAQAVLYAQLGGHLRPNETGGAVLDALRALVGDSV